MQTPSSTKIFCLSLCALIAFAANSVLCRWALIADTSAQTPALIDPIGFTLIRIAAAFVTLAMIMFIRNPKRNIRIDLRTKGSWLAAVLLFSYALCFSLAYVSLDTATGALILFASVQLTMFAYLRLTGHAFALFEVIGILLSCFGFLYLFWPQFNSPSLFGFLLMMMAGVAWGGYTLIGRTSQNPLVDTAYNFARALPMAIIVGFFMIDLDALQTQGILLAVLSGGLASGLGYALWYQVLPMLATSVAATSQLSVPVIAALGGLVFVAEPISMRLIVSGLIILGGILMVIRSQAVKTHR